MTVCDLAIIGSGMAATRLVETLRRRDYRGSISVLGVEKSLPYNRILLSPLLAGEIDWQQLTSHPAEWYAQQSVDLRLGQPVVAVDRVNRRLTCAGGAIPPSPGGPGSYTEATRAVPCETLGYRQLVFATGSRPARPAMPGIDLSGICGFRDLADVARLQQASGRGRHAVVLGGGLLGLEAAAALAQRGMSTTLVQRAPQLMNRQLDAVAAGYLQRAIEAHGVNVRTGDAPVAMLGDTCVSAVLLESGEHLPADLVVTATGIQPMTELAQAAGVEVNRGIVVNEQLRSSDENIFAIGECCELHGETVGLVAPIWQQVDVLAANLCGEARRFEASPYITMLKVSGVDVHVMGDTQSGPDRRVLTFQDRGRGIYKKLVQRGRRVIGALLYGDIADSQFFFNLIQNREAVDGDNCRLLLAGQTPDAARLASA